MLKYFLSSLVVLICLVTPSYAQETGASGLGGYVPPPLFGTIRPPPPEHKADDLGLPVISKKIVPQEEQEKRESAKAPAPSLAPIKDPIVKQVTKKPVKAVVLKPLAEQKLKIKKIRKEAPKPVEKPKAIGKKPVSIIKEPVEVIPVKPGPEPIDLLERQDISSPSPSPLKKTVKKVTSEGVVKGPKTMPANKKKQVETEVIFKSDKPPAPTNILERVKSPEPVPQVPPLKTKEDIARMKERLPLPTFVGLPDGSKKLAMLYLETQSDIKETQINTLEQLIVPSLEGNKSARLIIEAYASSQDDGLNSARRLALSRALAIRSYLLSRKIEASRIDVRALGSESNIQPLDRVELIIAP